MNREIKFRIWNIASEQMSKPFYINERVNQVFNTNAILMQFTGLKDKNGIDIYEEDILLDANKNNKYNVFRVDGGFAINTHQNDFNKNTPFYESIADMQTASYISGNYEVIGNIYETK